MERCSGLEVESDGGKSPNWRIVSRTYEASHDDESKKNGRQSKKNGRQHNIPKEKAREKKKRVGMKFIYRLA
jgi:hypothetical protein